MSKQRIYLDYASATPLDKRVADEMLPFWSDIFFNASAIYEEGRLAKDNLNSARQNVAKLIGARAGEIIFTSGGTESNNLAIKGVMEQFTGANCIVSSIEHESVIQPAKNYKNKLVKVDTIGKVNPDDIKKLLDDNTVLVSVQFANNEIGTIQPIKEIAEFIKHENHQRQKKGNELPLYLHTDACQAVNYLDVNINRLGVDLMTINGGKIYGPKSSGILFVKTGIKIKSLIEGGGQEFNWRSGTENLAMAVGFAKALEIATKNHQNESKKVANLAEQFIKELDLLNVKFRINGPKKNRLPNNLHLSFDGIDNERLLIRLDLAGVSASAGSACSASSHEPSHVLRAIGQSDDEARTSIRFSFGRQTTTNEIKKAVKKLSLAIDKEH